VRTSARGRVAVVTGAGSGIGRATAELLLEQGWCVVGVDLDLDRLGWLDAAERGAAVAGDVSTEAANEAMVTTALERFGSLDALVLNAGIAHIGSLDRVHSQLIDRVLAVNLRGVALGLHAALPALQSGRDPAVVTVASISGMQGEPAMAIYAASKGGVINLTRSAAVELGPRGIRVNCVCPGATVTAMTQPVMDLDPALAATVERNIPLKRFARPAEIAQVIAFLASPAASFVHGAVIPVDGGVTANVGQYPPPDPPSIAGIGQRPLGVVAAELRGVAK
jgi:meso-butanediol dehydrogenase / (S,S)-butanediol dehydrogenase / diacetyl reductase